MRGDRPDILWLDKDPRTLCNTDAARAILAVAHAAVTTGKAIEGTVGDPAAGTPPGISATFLIG